VEKRSLKSRVETWFDVKNRGSTIKTEIRAGFVNFLANFYLIVVVRRFCVSDRKKKYTQVVSFIIWSYYYGVYIDTNKLQHTQHNTCFRFPNS